MPTYHFNKARQGGRERIMVMRLEESPSTTGHGGG